MLPNFFAPAVTQRMTSLLMLLSKTVGGILFCRKTRAFRSFQMVHPNSMAREAMAFRLGVLLLDLFTHHSFKESSRCQVDVSRSFKCTYSLTKFHRRRVNRHLKKRCAPVSCSLLQRGHMPQFDQPRFSKRSAVQILSCRASRAKNLIFGGAHIFQIMRSMGERVRPRNWGL